MTTPAPTAHPAAAPACHGYTLRDIGQIAARAAARHWSRAADPADRYDAAWHGIAEALSQAAAAPSRDDLFRAARAEISRLTDQHYRAHGLASHTPQHTRAWQQYWWQHTRPQPSWDETVTERVALTQIWPRLSPVQQQALLALATHGDYRAAAAATGKSYTTYRVHLTAARRAFRALWHEHETPSGMWGCDRRVFRRGGTPHRSEPVTRTIAKRARQRRQRAAEDDSACIPQPATAVA